MKIFIHPEVLLKTEVEKLASGLPGWAQIDADALLVKRISTSGIVAGRAK